MLDSLRYGESSGNLHQIAEDSTKKVALNIISDGHIRKRIDQYQFFIDNWDRLGANQIEIVAAYIESSADLFNRYQTARGKPGKIYFWTSIGSWVLMLSSVGIPFSLLQDAKARGISGENSLIFHLFLSPFASVLVRLPGVPTAAKDRVSQFLANRPEVLHLFDALLMVGCIAFVLGVVLNVVSLNARRRKIISDKKSLETQLMMTRRLYAFLSSHKKQSLKRHIFRYPNPKYAKHRHLRKYIEVNWDKLRVDQWLLLDKANLI